MKKGLLSLVLIALLSLFLVIGAKDTKAYSEYDKLYTGYKNINNAKELTSSQINNIKSYLAFSTTNASQNYSYQSLIVWLDNDNVKQYTFYDMCFIQYFYTDNTHFHIDFTFENQVGYTGLSPSLELVISYNNNEQINFYYQDNGTYTLQNEKLIGFYLADNWEDDRVLDRLKNIFGYSTYDYLTLLTIFNEDLNSAQVDTQFLLEDYDHLVWLTESYMQIINQMSQDYHNLEIQYENLQNILEGIGSEQVGIDTFFYNLFNNFKTLFQVQIIPGFNILTFVAIPLMLALLGLCIHVLKG